jgi:hypothetical protein
MSAYDVFISYRRGDGAEVARLIRYALMDRGLKVFLDVENLGSGHFDEKLLETIAVTPHFILVLSRDTLTRCHEPEDWVRREILQALNNAKNIVPIMADDFAFDTASLPQELKVLQRHNGLKYNHEYFEAMIGRLLEYLGHADGMRATANSSPRLRSPDYIFLDFDGVLRPDGSQPYVLDKRCLQVFEELMREHSDTRIVVTSSWRLAMSRSELTGQFSQDIRARIVGVTPEAEDADDASRHREILMYLKNNKATQASWIAIDDDPERYRPGCVNLILTDPKRGIDDDTATKIRTLLTKQQARP